MGTGEVRYTQRDENPEALDTAKRSAAGEDEDERMKMRSSRCSRSSGGLRTGGDRQEPGGRGGGRATSREEEED